MRTRIRLVAGIALLFAGSLLVHAQNGKAREWLTWGGDAERSGWNRSETLLSRTSVRNLELKWKARIDPQVPVDIESGASMLTAPLSISGVRTPRGSRSLILTLAASNTVAALDSTTGAIVWQRKLENAIAPASAATWICTNTSTATPVVDRAKGLAYVLAADGRIHALALGTGDDEMEPVAFVPPYARSWSLNLVDGILYTTVGRGCGNGTRAADSTGAATDPSARGAGGRAADAASLQAPTGRQGGRGPSAPPVVAHMVAMDLNDPKHPVSRFVTSIGRPSGAWSRAGVAWATNSILVQTADGAWDPSKNLWGETLVRLAPKSLTLMDYFTPPNLEELNTKDLDFGSGGVVAFTYKNRPLVVTGGKDGTIYLLDGASLGGADHRTPLFSLKIGNDAMMYASNGIWGAPATALDARGERWLYVPMWGPPSKSASFKRTNGTAPHGSIMALQVTTVNDKPVLVPMWVSRDLEVADPPVVANGVVFALSTGENTIQRHTDPRYAELYQRPNEPPISTQGNMTAEERGQHVTHATLYALDAETGQELFSSKDSIDDWTHLSSVSVADGKVFVTTRQTNVYAFGLKK